MEEFTIRKNDYLEKDVTGYYHQPYTGYKQKGNPDFLNILKNTFDSEPIKILIEAKKKVINILIQDIPKIMEYNGISNCTLVCVPRAKSEKTYSENQLMFKQAIKIAAKHIDGVVDGTNCIRRFKNTFTTHLSKATKEGKILNDGDKPYPGITVNTCEIDKSKINGKRIILIDDIYTKGVNVDEDCIQALINNGANKIIFYSIGYTRRV